MRWKNIIFAMSMIASSASLACDAQHPSKFVNYLYETETGGSDNRNISELHFLDLNQDEYLDAYTVIQFWVNGGAGDAAEINYYKGTKDGICKRGFNIQIDAISDIKISVSINLKKSEFPIFIVDYLTGVYHQDNSGIKITPQRMIKKFAYNEVLYDYREIK